jgi:hypothetical protein
MERIERRAWSAMSSTDLTRAAAASNFSRLLSGLVVEVGGGWEQE